MKRKHTSTGAKIRITQPRLNARGRISFKTEQLKSSSPQKTPLQSPKKHKTYEEDGMGGGGIFDDPLPELPLTGEARRKTKVFTLSCLISPR